MRLRQDYIAAAREDERDAKRRSVDDLYLMWVSGDQGAIVRRASVGARVPNVKRLPTCVLVARVFVMCVVNVTVVLRDEIYFQDRTQLDSMDRSAQIAYLAPAWTRLRITGNFRVLRRYFVAGTPYDDC